MPRFRIGSPFSVPARISSSYAVRYSTGDYLAHRTCRRRSSPTALVKKPQRFCGMEIPWIC
jgi:hypothetical protein